MHEAEIRNEARRSQDRGRARRSSAYEGSLSAEDVAEVEKIAGEKLRCLGYTF